MTNLRVYHLGATGANPSGTATFTGAGTLAATGTATMTPSTALRVYHVSATGAAAPPTALRVYHIGASGVEPTGVTKLRVYHIGASGSAGVTLVSNVTQARPGDTVSVSAQDTAGNIYTSGTYRIASVTGNQVVTPTLDTSTGPAIFRAPANGKPGDATNCTITVGYLQTGFTEQFITITVIRSPRFVFVGGTYKPTITSVFQNTVVAAYAMPATAPAGWTRVASEDFTGTPLPIGSFLVGAAGSGATDGRILSTAAAYSRYYNTLKLYPDGFPDTYNSVPAYPSKVLSTRTDLPNTNGVLDIYHHSESVGGVMTPMGNWLRLLLPANASSMTYGRMSIRYRSDSLTGYGGVSLIIPDGSTKSEIDFPEGELGAQIKGNFHLYDLSKVTPFTASPAVYGTDWHIYTKEWSPNLITCYVDNVVAFTTTTSVGGDPEKFVALQTGGTSGTAPASSVSGHTQIDWITIDSLTST